MARKRRRSVFDRILDDLDEMLYDVYERYEQQSQQQAEYQDSDYGNGPSPQQTQHVTPLTAEEQLLYIEIVELGFREAVKKYHPDREGGDAEKAACVNALRDKVRAMAGIKR